MEANISAGSNNNIAILNTIVNNVGMRSHAMIHLITGSDGKLKQFWLRCTAADVSPGETVSVKVALLRGHAYDAAELKAYRRANATAAEAPSFSAWTSTSPP